MYPASVRSRPVSGGHRHSKAQPPSHRRTHSLERRKVNHADSPTGNYELDGNCQPVSYSGTQVNIFGGPPNADRLNQILGQAGGAGTLMGSTGTGEYPYGLVYPPAGYTNNVQLGLMTEHMLRKLDESRMLTVSELMRRTYGPPTPYVQEVHSPREAIEYHPKAKSFSPGHGDWKGQIEHIYAHLLEIAQQDRHFRVNIGEPKFGEIVNADLDEDERSFTLKISFAKSKDDQERGYYSNRRQNQNGIDVSSPENHRRRQSHQSSPTKKTVSIVDDRKTSVESKVKQEIEKEPQYEKENYRQEATLKPYKNFNAEVDADALRKAMKGLGTDEKAIINILGKRTSKQRQEIIRQYKTMFGKDLVKDLKSELSGDFDKVIRALCLMHVDFDATELRNAIKGLGTNDSTLIEIICTRTNKTLQAIQESYKKLYNKSLEQDIMDDTSGHYQRLLVSLLQANRDESDQVDRHQAKKDAQMLYESGPKRWGTDESKFNSILVSRSYPQLRATFKEYEKLTKKSVEETIKSELSGDLAQGMITIVQCVQNKQLYFATRLYKAIKGAGTDDSSLIRIVVSRCEVDMVQIKEEFQRNFKSSLGQFIADDTSGDYALVLLTLIGESGVSKKEKQSSNSGRHSAHSSSRTHRSGGGGGYDSDD